METLLSVRELRCGYGGGEVLARIDLAVRAGEFVGLLGPNGSGKTTLLRAATRVIRPEAGTIAVGEIPIERLSARDLARRLAVIPQDTDAAFPFSVAEIVEMGRYAHAGPFDRRTARDEAAARRAMEQAGVLAFRDRDFAALSAGERQRVLFARALAQEAPLLLVDEPTAHLDVRYQVEMLDLLRALTEGADGFSSPAPGHDGTAAGTGDRGPGTPRAVLAVLHDLNLASRYCTRIALLKGGRIAADGPASEVLTPGCVRDVFGAEVDVVQVDGETHLIVGRVAGAERRVAAGNP